MIRRMWRYVRAFASSRWDKKVEEILRKSEAERVWAERRARRLGIEIKVTRRC